MKIFVTGFERSGTTLLNSLIGAHPEVKRMWHEKAWPLTYSKELLTQVTSFSEKESFDDGEKKRIQVDVDYDWLKDTWGDKVPYCNLYLNNKVKITIWDLCSIWLQWWHNEARIVHLVRHPWDTIFSTYSRKQANPSPKFTKYQHMVPAFLQIFRDHPQVLHIKYEYLLEHPEYVLVSLFQWLGLSQDLMEIQRILDGDIVNFGKINPTRAFNYRDREFDRKKFDIKHLLQILNGPKIQGPKYEEK